MTTREPIPDWCHQSEVILRMSYQRTLTMDLSPGQSASGVPASICSAGGHGDSRCSR